MFGSAWESLPKVREWLGGPAGCPGVVGRPSQISRSGREASLMSGSGQYLGVVESPAGCLGVVERLSRMSGSGQEALPDVREWWEALLDVREACRMSGSGREAYPNVRKWSGNPPVC